MQVIHLGFGPDYVDYLRAWDLQRDLHAKVVAGQEPDTALLLEHDPDAFLESIVRPMPRRPSPAARFGTRFHAWVEHHLDPQAADPLRRDPVELEGADPNAHRTHSFGLVVVTDAIGTAVLLVSGRASRRSSTTSPVGTSSRPSNSASLAPSVSIAVTAPTVSSADRGAAPGIGHRRPSMRASGGAPTFEIPGAPGAQMGMINLSEMLGKALGGQMRARRMPVEQALATAKSEEADKLLDQEQIVRTALASVEQNAIVFLDEIDKIAGRSEHRIGADVSREGVQRDLLPRIERTTVTTRHGSVKTDHILFIASGEGLSGGIAALDRDVVDRGLAGIHYLRQHPEWLAGSAVLALLLKPRRIFKWSQRGWLVGLTH